jgi:hypothetical protein
MHHWKKLIKTQKAKIIKGKVPNHYSNNKQYNWKAIKNLWKINKSKFKKLIYKINKK